MQYSCGYWKEAQSLEAAQQAKLDLICRKLELEPHAGTGYWLWMGRSRRIYGAKLSGQRRGCNHLRRATKMARARCADLDVEIRLRDYRDLHDSFDRIVSVGMFEHVGPKNYATYFEVADRNLKPNGRFYCTPLVPRSPTITLTRGSINISSRTAACLPCVTLPKPARSIL